MQAFMERLVPEGQAWYAHTLEGADDSPSHLRAMLTLTSVTVPIDGSRLSLGIWQGIHVFEHRARSQQRRVLLRCLSVD
jgi:secondary thiamine-phosphate synthase enzyme